MIKMHSSCLSRTALIATEQLLQQETENPPIGIVVSLDLASIVGEILEGAKLNGLRLTILRDAPPCFWILYNTQMCVIADVQ